MLSAQAFHFARWNDCPSPPPTHSFQGSCDTPLANFFLGGVEEEMGEIPMVHAEDLHKVSADRTCSLNPTQSLCSSKTR